MVNAPPCAACGYPLRWIPESNGWGCDRCRQFYPAQPQPQQPPAPQPQQHYQQAGYGYSGAPAGVPGGGSKIGLWVVLALLVVAGGVVGLVFALRGGGGGMASPEALIKATLAAESEGNVEALMKLADYPAAFAMGLDCKGEAARDADIDPDKLVKKLQGDMDELVKTTKGLTIELLESKREEGGKGDKTEKGKEVAPGCTAKAALEFITYSVKLKVTKDGKSGEQNTKFAMLDVDGHYFMFKPPRVKPPSKGGAVLDKLTAFRDQMCACMDAACGDKVDADFKAWSTEMSKDMSDDKPDEETAKRAGEILPAYFACQKKLASP